VTVRVARFGNYASTEYFEPLWIERSRVGRVPLRAMFVSTDPRRPLHLKAAAPCATTSAVFAPISSPKARRATYLTHFRDFEAATGRPVDVESVRDDLDGKIQDSSCDESGCRGWNNPLE